MRARHYHAECAKRNTNHAMSPEFSPWVKDGSKVGVSGQAGFARGPVNSCR
jgi:hypothetical protein